MSLKKCDLGWLLSVYNFGPGRERFSGQRKNGSLANRLNSSCLGATEKQPASPQCGDVPARPPNLILKLLDSWCVSFSSQNNVINLVLYSFRTIAVCREDRLEEMSWGQRSPGEKSAGQEVAMERSNKTWLKAGLGSLEAGAHTVSLRFLAWALFWIELCSP